MTGWLVRISIVGSVIRSSFVYKFADISTQSILLPSESIHPEIMTKRDKWVLRLDFVYNHQGFLDQFVGSLPYKMQKLVSVFKGTVQRDGSGRN
jgi:hypothetical protein